MRCFVFSSNRNATHILLAFFFISATIQACNVLAATFIVSSTFDTGAGSLRSQIAGANATPGADDIIFSIAGTGPFVIQPLTALPTVSDTLTIDGYSQAGASPATEATPATILIVIDGDLVSSGASGLKIAASNCMVKGLSIGHFPKSGIYIENTHSVKIEGNHIGADASGTASMGNFIEGILLDNAWNNTIGGLSPEKRNVISGGLNYGVWLGGSSTTGNLIQGNFIGIDATGADPLGNSICGILFSYADNNTIGGSTVDARNIISGNSNRGIDFFGESNNNVIQGNFIGVNAFGDPCGNLTSGILFSGQNDTNNSIGGTNPGEGNTIAFNGSGGIVVFDSTSIENTFFSNSIYANTYSGIGLGSSYGPYLNDPGDTDMGFNNLQNHPVLTLNDPGPPYILVDVYLNSAPSTNYYFEFFANEEFDESGFGEGQIYLGYATSTTDVSGETEFTVFFDPLPEGYSITATATDPAGNTSEFSQMLPIGDVLNLECELIPGQLALSWSYIPGLSMFWMYGAPEEQYFQPGFESPFDYRIGMHPAGTSVATYPSGIGDPDWNWTYILAAIGQYGQVVSISRRVGQWDFGM